MSAAADLRTQLGLEDETGLALRVVSGLFAQALLEGKNGQPVKLFPPGTGWSPYTLQALRNALVTQGFTAFYHPGTGWPAEEPSHLKINLPEK